MQILVVFFINLLVRVCYSLELNKLFCHVHMHAILSGLFYATFANLHHYVVLTLLGGVEHTRVNWDLASVTCLGIFCGGLMSETHYN
jgi:hypothetical protein